MSELIALLLVTVGQLLSVGTPPPELAAQVRTAVIEAAPMDIADVAVLVAPEPPAESELPPVDPSSAADSTAPAAADAEQWRLSFMFDDIYLEPLLVDALEIGVGQLQLSADGSVRIGSIEFSAEFTEEALTSALREKAATVRNPRVQLDPEGITLKGNYVSWIGHVPFEVRGNLSVEEQTQLIFTIDKSKMIGVPIPGAVNRIIQQEVNPVYDLDAFAERSRKDIERARDLLDYEFYLEVERITPRQGHIIVVGHA